MALKNNLQTTTEKAVFSDIINSAGFQKSIMNTLNDITATKKFTSTLISMVNNDKKIAECNAKSIVVSGLQAEALNLPINNQLGFVYIVPFKNNKEGTVNASFQLGYKGYIQLALRSGKYKRIHASVVKEGELTYRNRIKGDFKFEPIQDEEEWEKKKVIGYYAFFELMSGYMAETYWTIEEMKKYADRYSQAFKLNSYNDYINGKIPSNEMWKYSSYWYENFDEMGLKTVIKQLLSKQGFLSTEIQEAIIADNGYSNANGEYITAKDGVVLEEEIEEVVVEEVKKGSLD